MMVIGYKDDLILLTCVSNESRNQGTLGFHFYSVLTFVCLCFAIIRYVKRCKW